jgi:glycosyltransferase involved in cell wall biosynthesis
MKIVQISTGYDISINGGITNYVRNLSSKLVENGHQVFVIYSQKDGLPKNYPFECIPITTILNPFHRKSVVYNKDVINLQKIISEIKPDVIHVHMMIDLPVDVLKMFKANAKLIISLHDYSFLCNRIVLFKKSGVICNNSNENKECNYCIESFETTRSRVVRKLLMLLKQYVYKEKIMSSSGHHERFVTCREYFKQADALVAVSTKVKQIYESNGFTNNLFVVNHIGNYTAEDEFRANFANKKNIEKYDKIKFCFMGNFHKAKGTDMFLQLAAASLKNEFHIYGELGNIAFAEQITQHKNIYYHGMYNHSDLIDILKSIHIGLVLPIWEDNAPQVVFEFLNANIPVIGTKMGGLTDFIDENNGFLFDNNEDGIKAVIAFINSDEIYSFYNKIINGFSGTKKPIQHAIEMIRLYEKTISQS